MACKPVPGNSEMLSNQELFVEKRKDGSVAEFHYAKESEKKLTRILYPNGNVHQELDYFKFGGIKKHQVWYKNGNLKYIEYYDELEELISTEKYAGNCQMLKLSNFSQGNKDGLQYEWFSSGCLKKIRAFLNGVEVGDYFEFHPNGVIKLAGSYGTFIEGDAVPNIKVDTIEFIDSLTGMHCLIFDKYRKPKNGIWKEYDEEGNFRKEITYEKGEVIFELAH